MESLENAPGAAAKAAGQALARVMFLVPPGPAGAGREPARRGSD